MFTVLDIIFNFQFVNNINKKMYISNYLFIDLHVQAYTKYLIPHLNQYLEKKNDLLRTYPIYDVYDFTNYLVKKAEGVLLLITKVMFSRLDCTPFDPRCKIFYR